MSQTIRRGAQGPVALAGGIEEEILPSTFVGDGFNQGIYVENQDALNPITVVTIYTRAEFDSAESPDVWAANIPAGRSGRQQIGAPVKWIRITATPALAIAGARCFAEITKTEGL